MERARPTPSIEAAPPRDPGVSEVEHAEELRSAILGEEEGEPDQHRTDTEPARPPEPHLRGGLHGLVVERPLLAIAGALAAGFLVGRLLSRTGGSRWR